MKSQITEQALEYWAKAQAIWPELGTPPEIEFVYRGAYGGKAYYMDHRVRYNVGLAKRHPDEFEQTVGHEIAHIVCWLVHGTTGHGPEWKAIMVKLGLEPRRCHAYDVKGLKKRYYKIAYACECREYELTLIRHNRILQGQTYSCRNCRGTLKLQS